MPENARIELLRSLDEIGRYQLFVELYGSQDPEDRRTIAEALCGTDLLLKMLLLQYLAEIPEPRAVAMILDLIESDNEALREAAFHAYLRNSFTRKHKLLRPHVLSDHAGAARFAVRTLSRLGDADILPAILVRLDKAPDELKREILRALGCLPDSRARSALEHFAVSSEEEWRYRAARALVELKSAGIRVRLETFMALTQDPSERVRRAAVEGLQRFSSKRISRLFMATALDRTAPVDSRRRAVQALIHFPDRRWVSDLISLMLKEPEALLRLTAEITLKRFPRRQLKAGLLPLLERHDPACQQRATLLLAETLGDDPEVRRRLMGCWERARGLQEKLGALEVLGELGGPEARAVVLRQVSAEPVLAYTALGTLERLWTRDSGPQIFALLKDPALPQLSVQEILNALIRRGPDEAIREELFLWLREALLHPVTNIRYLSLRLIARYPLDRTLEFILRLLAGEEDLEVVTVAYEVVLRGLDRNPRPLIEAALKSEDPRTRPHLVEMLCRGTWAQEHAFPMLTRLTSQPLALPVNDPAAFLRMCVGLMENGSLTLVHGWLFATTDDNRRALLEKLRDALRDPGRSFPPLPLDFISFHLAGGDAAARALFYELVGLSLQSAGISMLTAALLKENDPAALATGRAALRRLIAEAPVRERT